MAKSGGRSAGGKCCMALGITVLVIIVLLGVGVAVVLNLTPAKMGIADVEIAGTTLTELGLADVKIINILKDVAALAKVKEEDIVTNGYSQEIEPAVASALLSGSSLKTDTGEMDYSTLFTADVTYTDGNKVVLFPDTTLAYILNQAVKSASDDAEYAEVLKDAEIEILEITINKVDDNKATITIIGNAMPGSFTEQMDESAQKLVPDSIYVTVKSDFTVEYAGEHKGQITSNTVTYFALNGKTAEESTITNAILVAIAKAAGKENADELGDAIVKAATGAINHLGKIASATVDHNGYAVNVDYGMSGVRPNQISVVTNGK